MTFGLSAEFIRGFAFLDPPEGKRDGGGAIGRSPCENLRVASMRLPPHHAGEGWGRIPHSWWTRLVRGGGVPLYRRACETHRDVSWKALAKGRETPHSGTGIADRNIVRGQKTGPRLIQVNCP